MPIKGSCHCGNIRFELGRTPAPDRIPARARGRTRRQRNWIADVRFVDGGS